MILVEDLLVAQGREDRERSRRRRDVGAREEAGVGEHELNEGSIVGAE